MILCREYSVQVVIVSTCTSMPLQSTLYQYSLTYGTVCSGPKWTATDATKSMQTQVTTWGKRQSSDRNSTCKVL